MSSAEASKIKEEDGQGKEEEKMECDEGTEVDSKNKKAAVSVKNEENKMATDDKPASENTDKSSEKSSVADAKSEEKEKKMPESAQNRADASSGETDSSAKKSDSAAEAAVEKSANPVAKTTVPVENVPAETGPAVSESPPVTTPNSSSPAVTPPKAAATGSTRNDKLVPLKKRGLESPVEFLNSRQEKEESEPKVAKLNGASESNGNGGAVVSEEVSEPVMVVEGRGEGAANTAGAEVGPAIEEEMFR